MSGVLALVVLAVVLSALSRRRRRWPGRTVPRIGAVDTLVRSAVRATLATLAAGAVLFLFGQEASAQTDEPLAPPTSQPADDVEVEPTAPDVPAPGDEPVPPAESTPAEGSDDPGGVDTLDLPAPAEPPAVPTPTGGVTDPAAPSEPPAPPTPPATEPPPPVATPTPPAAPSEPAPVPVATPSTPNVGLWNVALTGRASVRSSGPNITIKFEGDGPELMRAASDVSGIVITGSDGDDSLEVSDGLGVLVRYEGGAGVDALVMPSSGATVRFTGSRAGELFDRFGALLVSFAGVDDVIGGPGEDTFVAAARSDLRSLQMGPGDRFVVELEPGADGAPTANLLTVDSVDLAGTLDVSGASSGLTGSTPVPFLSFGTAQGDFTSFRGLDLGDGAYVRPTTVAGGYELRAADLPDGIAIRFPSATDADEFFTFLSGKGNAFRSGTPVTIQLRDHELTGALAVSGTPEAAILTLTDAKLRFGGGHDALLTLEDEVATLTLTESKLSGTLDGSLTTTVPDVSFAGTFAVTLDSDGRSIEAVGDDVTVTIAGYTFSGVDVVVTVVGDGAHMALLITAPTGAAVLIPIDGTSGLHAGTLAAALERAFGVSLTPPSMAGIAEATVGSGLDSHDGATAIMLSPESTAHSAEPPSTIGAQPSRSRAGDAVLTGLHTLGPLLALVGVAGPLVVALSTSTASGGTSCPEPAPLAAAVAVPPVLVAPRSTDVLLDEAFTAGGVTTTALARGPPGGSGTAIASEIHVRLTSSPQRIPGAQGPFLVTTTSRTAAVSVESGRVDRAPGTLLSLIFLPHLLWTRGRRSTRPIRPCRRRARGSLLATGDAGGVTGRVMASPAVRTPAAPCTSRFAATGSGGPVAASCPDGGRPKRDER